MQWTFLVSITVLTLFESAFARSTSPVEGVYPYCRTYNYQDVKLCVIQNTVMQDGFRIELRKDLDYVFETLEFRNCTVHALPDGMFSNRRIQAVQLSNSSLANITAKDFVGADSLVTLNLSHNALQAIDDRQFARAAQLRSIVLAHNRIGRVAEAAFEGLAQLGELYLNDNALEAWPSTMALAGLRVLQLRNNSLRGEFELMRHVSLIDVSHNDIERYL